MTGQNSKLRVLIVDDAALVRLFYRRILEPAGYEIEEALNGLEGVERHLTLRADLLIVDINMPQMDGLTFVRTLRRQDLPYAGTPVLVTSTETGAKDFAAARAAGANFYLPKPVNPEALLACVALVCGDAMNRSGV
jgi:two-component system chemotaxis response regulator CheY